MKISKIVILIVQFCFLSPFIVTAQSVAPPKPGTNVLATNEPKDNDVRIKDMEQRMLEMESIIRKLSAEVERLRAERDKDGPSLSVAGAKSESAPIDNSVATSSVPNTPADSKPNQDPKGKSTIVESILPGVKLSGSVLLYAYSPIRVEGSKPFFDLYSAGVNLDREGDNLGFHIEFRFRSTKFRSFFD
ncbi:MAG TPA: bZIP transcription factor, partial [Blastocatellia bacterium]|nr:bZIP transcription factor [Blastocatellia bacterium]